jgi:Cys-tRNA(Pro)/Cys-tRNA(Cys) deacylase
MPQFYISGGRIGVQIHLSPQALVKAIRGKFEDLVLAQAE